ncbi:T9SS type A sorting domain-containing protein [Winogradskyella sp. UBA3174]|uniref:T9SS type A sorting domain-containing protein n=1 Tax=Winogradskyella sp. UBA3174 TaxID=1947785 RepID=UPI0025FE1F16|nr:T9SS type A sorting domain-containing protein [Winogradskyella sp. UBA3174]|tara:strand:- start:26658 stop:27749 length:1092 start_codon:yes stop_codon:yes gene_type:complete
MKFIAVNILIACSFLISSAQQLILETNLDATVNETSGLLFINNTLITHNDSGTTNQLFDVSITTGNVTRTVTITNATNIDWEDLTQDGTYIYIGDFGNFEGDRTDLKIYRILISDYFNSTSITAEVINYTYNDQTDFSTNPFVTNFDAEALLYFNNQLYIFSKNWIDGRTNIYELSKEPGTQTATLIDNFDSQGLITSGSYNTIANEILLCGYDLNGAFIVQLDTFSSGLFSNGTITKTAVTVPANSSSQIEAVIPINATEYYISGEENGSDTQALYSFNVSTLNIQQEDEASFSFYPNPANNTIILSHTNCKTEFYTITGQLVKTSTDKHIDISDLNSGIHLIKIQGKSTSEFITKRLIINH